MSARRASELPCDARWELTEAGRLALAREIPSFGRTDVAAATADQRACSWCGEEFGESDAIIAAGAGRFLHDTRSCRQEFEQLTAGAPNA